MGEISLDGLIGMVIGILVPILLWCWRVSANQKKVIVAIDDLTDMHLDENSVFSTKETNRMLADYMQHEKTTQINTVNSLNALNRAITELTYYIRWSTKQTTGQTPPPFVSDP